MDSTSGFSAGRHVLVVALLIVLLGITALMKADIPASAEIVSLCLPPPPNQ